MKLNFRSITIIFFGIVAALLHVHAAFAVTIDIDDSVEGKVTVLVDNVLNFTVNGESFTRDFTISSVAQENHLYQAQIIEAGGPIPTEGPISDVVTVQSTLGSNVITIRFGSDPDLFALDPNQGISMIAESVASNSFFPVAFFPVGTTGLPTDVVRVKSDADISEPETYTLLLGGLFMIGFIASRRNTS